MTPRGTLFLLPTPIAEAAIEQVLPAATIDAARHIDYYLAEDAKTARAFLKAVGHPRPIREIDVVEIGHAPDPAQVDAWLRPLQADGRDGAIVSEAGCPGVADPGATLVARAHELGIAVRPRVGPSSLLLALMGSGLDGQRFRFVGYLPQDPTACAQQIRALEAASRAGETQFFIETPYRNERLFAALLEHCAPDTRLCVAVDMTGTGESIRTRTVAQWRALAPPDRPTLQRLPAVFLLLADAQAPSRMARADRGAAPGPGTPRPRRGGRSAPRRLR